MGSVRAVAGDGVKACHPGRMMANVAPRVGAQSTTHAIGYDIPIQEGERFASHPRARFSGRTARKIRFSNHAF